MQLPAIYHRYTATCRCATVATLYKEPLPPSPCPWLVTLRLSCPTQMPARPGEATPVRCLANEIGGIEGASFRATGAAPSQLHMVRGLQAASRLCFHGPVIYGTPGRRH